MQWKRIIGWACLILLAANVIALCSGIVSGYLIGNGMDYGTDNFRLVRRILIGIAAALLYWRFAARTPSRRFLHVLFVFVAIQVLDVAVTWLVFGVAPDALFDGRSLLRNFVAAMLGYGLSRMFTKPNAGAAQPMRAL